MATITSGATIPVAAPFNTSPAYSGTFIPTLWSSKLNAKFYTASTFASIANTNWEGDISGMGDKVVIQNIPDIAISTYVPGAGLQYQVPTPSTIELQIDQGKYYAFQVNDLLSMQAQPKLMDIFSNDAGMQMKVAIDSECLFATFTGAASANQGGTAGVKSASFNLGTVTAPFNVGADATAAIKLITSLAAVLDEQNIPETERFLLIDPVTRQQLMNSNLQQAYLTGDNQSILRNGKIGGIDRFEVYVTNNLPRGAASGTTWTSGDGSQTKAAGGTFAQKSRVILAGHKSAISFASQFTKTEQVRNPSDFGDYVRGINVYGRKVVKDSALALAIVY
jgi:hypothetical protein